MPLYDPPLRLILDSDALVANWRWLGARGGAPAGAAIKADGYGLGAREVAARLAEAGCRDFFVASWGEALALGDLPHAASLAVLHGVRSTDMAVALASRARPVLASAEMVARWKEAAPERPCDVMVDTGMNRLGLSIEEVRSGLLDGLLIDTLLSHLACADEVGHPLNDLQLARFVELRGAITAQRYSLANSAGICLGTDYGFDLTRPGLALYGGIPRAEAEGHIAPVARIEAEILQVRDVLAGETVGYGATFTATRPTRVAILNLGYADGYFRAFAGHGFARGGDRVLPLAGRVSMDLIAVDLGDADLAAGDWLEIDHDLPAAAAATGMSQYELLTGLGSRYQRVWK
ncbi:alanine racemase [Sphingomonas montanisoli]|uniref:Alanine racemase n=1 Tax=Sphingomonas montanisoli TaxID=2606412 RepID=A0A5D9CD53_9SPHN|nr:alanine racemase [Sphingomonas montanisoli]TZG29183.1 alanine racemase [Sphingomonas montanisoli]